MIYIKWQIHRFVYKKREHYRIEACFNCPLGITLTLTSIVSYNAIEIMIIIIIISLALYMDLGKANTIVRNSIAKAEGLAPSRS